MASMDRCNSIAALVLVAILLLTALPTLSSAEVAMRNPPVTFLCGDVRGAIEKAGTFGALFSGSTSSSIQMLRKNCGLLVGDAGLVDMQPGKNAVLYLWFNGDVTMFVPDTNARMGAHIQEIRNRGGFATSSSTMLVISSSQKLLLEAETLSDRAQKDLRTTSSQPFIEATIQVPELLSYYDARLEESIRTLRALAVSRQYNLSQSEAADKVRRALEQLNEVWFRSYWAILRRLHSVRIGLTIPESGLRLDCEFQPLHERENKSRSERADQLLKLLPAGGAIRSELCYDAANAGRVLSNIAQELANQMRVTQAKAIAWHALISSCFSNLDGCIAISEMHKDKPGFSAGVALGIRDDESCLNMLAQFPKLMGETGIADLYAKAGVKLVCEFQQRSRVYRSIPVHHTVYRMELSDLEQLPLGAMGLTDLSADHAIINHVLLVAMGSTTIEELIDRALKPDPDAAAELRSKLFLEPHGKLYMDYDLLEAFNVIGSVLPPTASNAYKRFKSDTQTSSSLSVAGYAENKRYRVTCLIPTELIQALKSAYVNSRSGSGTH